MTSTPKAAEQGMPHTATYVIVDVEGTMTGGAMWRGIGRYLTTHGHSLAYRLFVAANMPGLLLSKTGAGLSLGDFQNYKNLWLERQARLLAGFSHDQMAELARYVVDDELWPGRRDSVIDELALHHEQGRRLLIASGMYPIVLEELAQRFDYGPIEYVGTPLLCEDGRFTGRFAGPVCVGQEKARRAKTHLGDAIVAAAYGDTASDIPMMEMAAEPVAVCPERALAEEARTRGWRILEG